MRISGLLAGLCAVWVRSALAGPSPADLQTEGEALARDAHYTEAIEKFKAADKLEPRASHACLIALAYTRRELWSEAEIFLDKCHQRATPQDPLPDWVPEADKQIIDRLNAANVAPVEIVVTPAGAKAEVTVSSFAPDESFAPRTIHLPPGHHVILAKAEGYPEVSRAIDITDKTPQHVTIDLAAPAPAPTPTAPRAPSPSNLPTYVIGAGLGIGVVGAILHVAYYAPIHSKLDTASKNDDPATYMANSGKFDTAQRIVIGTYAVGGAVLLTGVILKYTAFKQERDTPVVGFAPAPGGGVVSIGWQR